MKYRHLFFDLDHTLWDFEENSRLVLETLYRDFGLEKKGIPRVEDFQSCFEQQNEKFWERYRRGYISREELRKKRFWHVLLAFKIWDYPLSLALSDAYLSLLPQQKNLVPYAEELLHYCRERGYQIHLLTNGFEPAQQTKMTRSGILHYFQQVITPQSCGYLKPQPEIFAFALKAAIASVSESLMIGDALEADVLGAQSFGMDQVFFNYRRKRHAEKPTYEIEALKDLIQIL